MSRKVANAVAAFVFASSATLSAPPTAHVGGTPQGVTMQGARLADTVGHYSVVLPAGWILDPGSQGGDLSFSDAKSRVTCRIITMDPSPLSVREQFNLFRDAQPEVYKSVTKVRQEWRTLDGERAGFLESRKTKQEGDRIYAWNVISVRVSRPYVIECQSLVDQAEEVRGSVEQLIGSFRWLANPTREDK